MIALLLLAPAYLSAAPATQPTAFPETQMPLLVLPSRQQVESLRQAVREGREAALPFQRDVRSIADTALLSQPAPLPRILYEGRVGSDPQRQRTIEHLRDMPKVTALAWTTVLHDDARYARAAVHWTTAWARACPPTGNDVNDNKLDALLLATHLLADRMEAADRQLCLDWAAMLGRKQSEGMEQAHGNRMAKRIKLMAASAVVTGDRAMLAAAREHYRAYIGSQLRPNGASVDLETRDALSYHVAALRNILEAGLILRDPHFDPYRTASAEGASVKKSVELVTPYARGEKVYAEWVHSKVDLDQLRWQAGDVKYKPGSPWDPAGALPLYRLAAVFDPELDPILEDLRQKHRSPLTWEDLLLR